MGIDLTRVSSRPTGISRSTFLGFGSFPICNGLSVLAVRFQAEAAQFYWLLDSTDEETYAAVDSWRKAGAVPTVILDGDLAVGSQSPMDIDDNFSFYRNRRDTQNPQSEVFIGTAFSMTEAVKAQATSDVPHVPRLTYVEAIPVVSRKLQHKMGGDMLSELRTMFSERVARQR
jgi:hypothetical protein